jgi:hypothetical protein
MCLSTGEVDDLHLKTKTFLRWSRFRFTRLAAGIVPKQMRRTLPNSVVDFTLIFLDKLTPFSYSQLNAKQVLLIHHASP